MLNLLKLPASGRGNGSVGHIARMMPHIAACNVFNTVVLTIAMFGRPDYWLICLWAFLSCVLYSYFGLKAALYKPKKTPKKKMEIAAARRRFRTAVVSSFVSAFPWSFICCYLLMGESAEAHMLAATIAVGMAAAGCVFLTYIPIAALTYMTTILVPVTFVCALLLPHDHAPYMTALSVSLMFFLYLVVAMMARVFEERTTVLDELRFSQYQIEETTEEIRKISKTDPMTGLKNRSAFMSEMTDILLSLAQSEEAGCALYTIDLDDFAQVNQTYGHVCGDKLITDISETLKGLWHENDVLARLSGDEFAVIAPGVRSASEADGLAQGLLAELQGQYKLGGHNIDVGTSIGAVFFSKTNVSAVGLMRIADNAMEIAKNAGGNRYWLHDLDNLWSALAPDEELPAIKKVS